MKLINKVANDIKNHYIVFIVCIVFSTLLFFYIKDYQLDRNVFVVELEYKNIPENFIELKKNSSKQKVRIYLKGDKEELSLVDSKILKPYIDCSNVDIGDNNLKIQFDNSVLSESIKFSGIEPKYMKINFDKIIQKQITIEPSYVNSLVDGYVIASEFLSSKTAEVSGPISILSNIETIKTKKINLAGVNSTIIQDVKLENSNINIISPSKITIIVEIKEEVELIDYEGIPVVITGLDEKFTYSLNYDNISAQLLIPGSIKDKIDLSLLSFIIDGTMFTETGKYQIIPQLNRKELEVLSIQPLSIIVEISEALNVENKKENDEETDDSTEDMEENN